jgi:plastocyanin
MIRWMSVLAMTAGLVAFGLLARPGSPAHAGGGGCHQPATDGRSTSVDLESNCFVNTVVRIDAGDTVTWTNRDSWMHSVTSAGVNQAGGWGSFDEMQLGDTLSHQFDASGVYPYFCVFHPAMVGAVVVGHGANEGLTAGVRMATDGASLAADAPRPSNEADVATASTASAGALVRIGLFLALASAAIAGIAAIARTRNRGASQ